MWRLADSGQSRKLAVRIPNTSEAEAFGASYEESEAVLVNAEIHVVGELNTDQLEELIKQTTHAIRDQIREANQAFIELRPPR